MVFGPSEEAGPTGKRSAVRLIDGAMGATQMVITIVWLTTIMLVYFVLYLALNYASCCLRRNGGGGEDGGGGRGGLFPSRRRRKGSILSALIDSDSSDDEIGDVV